MQLLLKKTPRDSYSNVSYKTEAFVNRKSYGYNSIPSGMRIFTVESHSIQTGLLLPQHKKCLVTLLKDIFYSSTHCQRPLIIALKQVISTCWDLRMAASISSTF